MEWIPNDLGSTTLNDHDVPILLTHVSEGLAFMHANGFTHRDLKPENILIRLSREKLTAAKIADFGTTKHDISGKMQTCIGSTVYMAPEFWEQELAYTKAVDMWSLGVIAVEFLTGWQPSLNGWDSRFPPSKTQYYKWIREVLQPRVAVAPGRFRSLLRGLLCENPKDRWTAIKCQEWLWKNAQADIGIQGITGSSRKRGASPLGEDIGDPDQLRRVRADNSSPPGSTIPDTEPWGSPH